MTEPVPGSERSSTLLDSIPMSVFDFGPRNPVEPPAGKSSPDRGTDQSTPDPAIAAGSTEDYGPAHLASRRILLVEDDEDARKAFAFRLNRMKLAVATAPDGQEACDLALAALNQRQPYDWILMDMQMPVVDGFEAARRLRSHGYDRPIIAITAYATEGDREECVRFGCNDHITKPIDWSRLAAILEKWLPIH